MPWFKMIRESVEKGMKDRIIKKAPKEYVDKLIPDFRT